VNTPFGCCSANGRSQATSRRAIANSKMRTYIFRSIRAGASGFLLKRMRPEDLIAAVHTVAAGDSLLSPSVTRRVIDRMAQQPTPEFADQTVVAGLTRREREVLVAPRPRSLESRDRVGPGRVNHQNSRQADSHEARPSRSRSGGHLRVRDRPDSTSRTGSTTEDEYPTTYEEVKDRSAKP
jgi:hypothetical protein